jgi:hypothetical protein
MSLFLLFGGIPGLNIQVSWAELQLPEGTPPVDGVLYLDNGQIKYGSSVTALYLRTGVKISTGTPITGDIPLALSTGAWVGGAPV